MPKDKSLNGPSLAAIKRLFGHSGNRCAFPRCDVKMIQGDTVIGRICHIKAARAGGPRHDAGQSQDARHGYENLILLCPTHHAVIDDDSDAYTVPRLEKMKADHESTAGQVPTAEIDRAAKLYLNQSVISINQSGGVTAHTVHQTIHIHPPHNDTEDREQQTRLTEARSYHVDRVRRIADAKGPVTTIDAGLFVLHVVPLRNPPSTARCFEDICKKPSRFAPMRTKHVQDWDIRYDGAEGYLLTGSNAEGLAKEQRAYTCVFDAPIVEAVHSDLAVGQWHEFLELPYIEALIVRYANDYCHSLEECGVAPPYAVFASLADVKDKKLLRGFLRDSSLRDQPYGALKQPCISFADVVLDSLPSSYNECAQRLQPILRRLANAAGLAASPSFDSAGNYTAAKNIEPV